MNATVIFSLFPSGHIYSAFSCVFLFCNLFSVAIKMECLGNTRMKTDFINFIKDQEWKSTEPVSSWFHPSFYLVSSMSALCQMSAWIRHCHGYLTEGIGMQIWGSYAVFLLATLFSGLICNLKVNHLKHISLCLLRAFGLTLSFFHFR
uniref:Uncharacterized protein n=1 Tax=Meleagris gallopavo TaxID=9103 RepID=A0A803XZY6_MELGA